MADRSPEIDFSVIIPARNEEKFLPGLLQSLETELANSDCKWELLLADNGSEDRTVEIARNAAASVIDCAGLTVGGARNRAAAVATGQVLVFLDSDMLVAPGWFSALHEVAAELRKKPSLVVGGSLAAPEDSGWIARAWFPECPATARAVRHVGSGHMIVARQHFLAHGGFNSALRTGEDYDFCRQTREAGGEIQQRDALKARHRGVPRTLRDFARREMWHGGSGSLRELARQRVSWLAFAWILIHLSLAMGLLLAVRDHALALLVVSAASLVCLPLMGAWRHRRRSGPSPISRLVLLYYIYFGARAVGLMRTAVMRPVVATGRAGR